MKAAPSAVRPHARWNLSRKLIVHFRSVQSSVDMFNSISAVSKAKGVRWCRNTPEKYDFSPQARKKNFWEGSVLKYMADKNFALTKPAASCQRPR